MSRETRPWTGLQLYCATRTLQEERPPDAAAAPDPDALRALGAALLRDWHALSAHARGAFDARARHLSIAGELATAEARIAALESGAVLGARRKRALFLPSSRGGGGHAAGDGDGGSGADRA